MEELTLEELRKEQEKAKVTHNQVERLVAGAKLKCDRMEAEYVFVSGEFEDKIEDGEMSPEEEKECEKRYGQATDAMEAALANLKQKQGPLQKARKRVLELRRLMKEKTAEAAVPRTSPGAPAVGLQPGDAKPALSASELFRPAQVLSSGESNPRSAEDSVGLGESEPVMGGEGLPTVAGPDLMDLVLSPIGVDPAATPQEKVQQLRMEVTGKDAGKQASKGDQLRQPPAKRKLNMRNSVSVAKGDALVSGVANFLGENVAMLSGQESPDPKQAAKKQAREQLLTDTPNSKGEIFRNPNLRAESSGSAKTKEEELPEAGSLERTDLEVVKAGDAVEPGLERLDPAAGESLLVPASPGVQNIDRGLEEPGENQTGTGNPQIKVIEQGVGQVGGTQEEQRQREKEQNDRAEKRIKSNENTAMWASKSKDTKKRQAEKIAAEKTASLEAKAEQSRLEDARVKASAAASKEEDAAKGCADEQKRAEKAREAELLASELSLARDTITEDAIFACTVRRDEARLRRVFCYWGTWLIAKEFEAKVLAFIVQCEGAHLKRVFCCWEAWLGKVRKTNSDMATRVEQENVELARELQTAADMVFAFQTQAKVRMLSGIWRAWLKLTTAVNFQKLRLIRKLFSSWKLGMNFAKGNKRSLVQSSLEAAASPAVEGEDKEGLRKAMAASLAEAQIQDETTSAVSPVENAGVNLEVIFRAELELPSEYTPMLVLIGSPGAGKTTCMSALKDHLESQFEIDVTLLPESATTVLEKYGPPGGTLTLVQFQIEILHEQLMQEDRAQRHCRNLRRQGRASIIIADNGALSGQAYAPDVWSQVLAECGKTEADLVDRYHGCVISLQSTATDVDLPYFYGQQLGSTNPHRFHDRVSAVALEGPIDNCWRSVSSLCHVKVQLTIEDKIAEVIAKVTSVFFDTDPPVVSVEPVALYDTHIEEHVDEIQVSNQQVALVIQSGSDIVLVVDKHLRSTGLPVVTLVLRHLPMINTDGVDLDPAGQCQVIADETHEGLVFWLGLLGAQLNGPYELVPMGTSHVGTSEGTISMPLLWLKGDVILTNSEPSVPIEQELWCEQQTADLNGSIYEVQNREDDSMFRVVRSVLTLKQDMFCNKYGSVTVSTDLVDMIIRCLRMRTSPHGLIQDLVSFSSPEAEPLQHILDAPCSSIEGSLSKLIGCLINAAELQGVQSSSGGPSQLLQMYKIPLDDDDSMAVPTAARMRSLNENLSADESSTLRTLMSTTAKEFLAQFMALLMETKVILSLPTMARVVEPAKLPNLVLDERLMEELGNIDAGPNDETKTHSRRMLTMFFKMLQAGRQKRMDNSHHSDMLSNECSASMSRVEVLKIAHLRAQKFLDLYTKCMKASDLPGGKTFYAMLLRLSKHRCKLADLRLRLELSRHSALVKAGNLFAEMVTGIHFKPAHWRKWEDEHERPPCSRLLRYLAGSFGVKGSSSIPLGMVDRKQYHKIWDFLHGEGKSKLPSMQEYETYYDVSLLILPELMVRGAKVKKINGVIWQPFIPTMSDCALPEAGCCGTLARVLSVHVFVKMVQTPKTRKVGAFELNRVPLPVDTQGAIVVTYDMRRAVFELPSNRSHINPDLYQGVANRNVMEALVWSRLTEFFHVLLPDEISRQKQVSFDSIRDPDVYWQQSLSPNRTQLTNQTKAESRHQPTAAFTPRTSVTYAPIQFFVPSENKREAHSVVQPFADAITHCDGVNHCLFEELDPRSLILFEMSGSISRDADHLEMGANAEVSVQACEQCQGPLESEIEIDALECDGCNIIRQNRTLAAENFEDGQHQSLEADNKPNRSAAALAGTAIEKSVKLMIYRRTEEQTDKQGKMCESGYQAFSHLRQTGELSSGPIEQFDVVGGKLEPGESFAEALRREASEELLSGNFTMLSPLIEAVLKNQPEGHWCTTSDTIGGKAREVHVWAIDVTGIDQFIKCLSGEGCRNPVEGEYHRNVEWREHTALLESIQARGFVGYAEAMDKALQSSILRGPFEEEISRLARAEIEASGSCEDPQCLDCASDDGDGRADGLSAQQEREELEAQEAAAMVSSRSLDRSSVRISQSCGECEKPLSPENRLSSDEKHHKWRMDMTVDTFAKQGPCDWYEHSILCEACHTKFEDIRGLSSGSCVFPMHRVPGGSSGFQTLIVSADESWCETQLPEPKLRDLTQCGVCLCSGNEQDKETIRVLGLCDGCLGDDKGSIMSLAGDDSMRGMNIPRIWALVEMALERLMQLEGLEETFCRMETFSDALNLMPDGVKFGGLHDQIRFLGRDKENGETTEMSDEDIQAMCSTVTAVTTTWWAYLVAILRCGHADQVDHSVSLGEIFPALRKPNELAAPLEENSSVRAGGAVYQASLKKKGLVSAVEGEDAVELESPDVRNVETVAELVHWLRKSSLVVANQVDSNQAADRALVVWDTNPWLRELLKGHGLVVQSGIAFFNDCLQSEAKLALAAALTTERPPSLDLFPANTLKASKEGREVEGPQKSEQPIDNTGVGEVSTDGRLLERVYRRKGNPLTSKSTRPTTEILKEKLILSHPALPEGDDHPELERELIEVMAYAVVKPLENQGNTVLIASVWVLAVKASDGEMYDLRAADPGSCFLHGNGDKPRWKKVSHEGSRVMVMEPPRSIKISIRAGSMSKQSTNSSAEAVETAACDGLNVEDKNMLGMSLTRLILKSKHRRKDGRGEHGESLKLLARIDAFQKVRDKRKDQLKSFRRKGFRSGSSKKDKQRVMKDVNADVKKTAARVTRTLKAELAGLEFPDGEALNHRLKVGVCKRIPKKIDKLNLSGDQDMIDSACAESLRYIFEDTDYTIDQSLCDSKDVESSFFVGPSFRREDSDEADSSFGEGTYHARSSSEGSSSSRSTSDSESSGEYSDGSRSSSGSSSSGQGDRKHRGAAGGSGPDSSDSSSSSDSGGPAKRKGKAQDLNRTSRDPGLTDEDRSRKRMSEKRNPFVRLKADPLVPFLVDEMLLSWTSKISVKSRDAQDVSIPNKEKIKETLEGLVAANPFVWSVKGEKMDMCKWFVNHIWNRGLQKVLLQHGARVLTSLTQLVLEIVFVKEGVDELKAIHAANNANFNDTQMGQSTLIAGNESRGGLLPSLFKRTPTIHAELKRRHEWLGNLSSILNGDIHVRLLEHLLFQCEKYHSTDSNLQHWERNLSKDFTRATMIDFAIDVKTEKWVTQELGAQELINAINLHDRSPTLMAGAKPSYLAKIHATLWLGNAAILSFAKARYGDTTWQRVPEDDRCKAYHWQAFSEEYILWHHQLFGKPNGLVGYSRQVEFGRARPEASVGREKNLGSSGKTFSSGGKRNWSDVSRGHMKGDRALRLFDAASDDPVSSERVDTAIEDASHVLLKTMIESSSPVLDSTGELLTIMNEQWLAPRIKRKQGVVGLAGLRTMAQGKSAKSKGVVPAVRAIPAPPRANLGINIVSFVKQLDLMVTANEGKLHEIGFNEELVRQLKAAKHFPARHELPSSKAAGKGVKCSVCAQTEFGRKMCTVLGYPNCQTHDDDCCHVRDFLMVCKKAGATTGSGVDGYWALILMNALYGRDRPRWGKNLSRHEAQHAKFAGK